LVSSQCSVWFGEKSHFIHFDYVVAVDCVNTFKTRLDKYWKDQDVMYDWTSEITGTGDRSEYILESTYCNTVLDTRIRI